MGEAFGGPILIAATVTMGLSAGLFCAFAYSVMPGLGQSGDRTFVEAMQRINAAILNAWFAVVFAGSMLLSVAAAVTHSRGDGRVLAWILGAVAFYSAVLVITFVVNVPLNNALNAAGGPDEVDDLAGLRQRFEVRWVRWNIARAVGSTAAFGCLTWALVLYGQASAVSAGG